MQEEQRVMMKLHPEDFQTVFPAAVALQPLHGNRREILSFKSAFGLEQSGVTKVEAAPQWHAVYRALWSEHGGTPSIHPSSMGFRKQD